MTISAMMKVILSVIIEEKQYFGQSKTETANQLFVLHAKDLTEIARHYIINKEIIIFKYEI